MKLGTETVSVVNHLQSRMVIGEPVPEVGMGATILGWSDRHPATIVGWDGKVLTIQRDNAERIDKNGLSETQEYVYTPNLNGGKYHFKKDKRGMWKEVVLSEKGRW